MGPVPGHHRVPVHGLVPAARLHIDARPQLVPVAPDLLGPLPRGRQTARGPPEVHEHVVGSLEEGLVLRVERPLPAHRAVHGHRVVPGHPLSGSRSPGLQLAQEAEHVGGEGGVAAAGLGVDEPAVEAVRPCHGDELSGQRVAPGGVLLHQVPGPLQLPAVGHRRQEHIAEHGHAVAVGGVHDRGVGREDQPLARGAAPEHQLVYVGPVGEGVVVGGGRALRGIARRGPEGDQGLDTGLARAGGRVHRRWGEPGGERDGRGIEGEVGVVGRPPRLEACLLYTYKRQR